MSATIVYGVVVSDSAIYAKLCEDRDKDKLPEMFDVDAGVVFVTESSWSSGDGSPVVIQPSVLTVWPAWNKAFSKLLRRYKMGKVVPAWVLFDL